LESTVRNQRAAAEAAAPLVLQLDVPRWHSFVGSRRDAFSFHHLAWAALVADCYGYRAFAFTLQASDGDIVAGAPVIEVTDPLRRRRWISLPFTDECPLLLIPSPRDRSEPFYVPRASTRA
jgi:hypothetical protein